MKLAPAVQLALIRLPVEGDLKVAWKRPGNSPVAPTGPTHLWRIKLDHAGKVGPNEWMNLLNQQECEHATRMANDEQRRRFIVRRVWLRVILARYASAAPKTLKFEFNAWGKPHLVQEGAGPADSIEFSTTHRDGLGLIAITRGREVGVDVEPARHDEAAIHSVAREFFSTAERNEVNGSPPENRSAVFARLWTRKEAVLKAEGRGVGGLTTNSDDGQMDALAMRFHVGHFTPSPGFIACIAVARVSR
jgi:4'-phosphopantetheinyl transferase